MCKEVIVIGAGGHGRVIADIIQSLGDKVLGFLDDDVSKHDILGKVDECIKYMDKFFIIGIGNNGIRRKIVEKYPQLQYYTAIHPTAVVANNVLIGEGTAIMANVVINTNVKVGRHCILNTSSVIEHDNNISDFAHISPGSVLCGNVSIGANTNVGANAVVRNNITIINDVQIGCGGVVVRDIEKPGIYVGVPVKEI